MPAKKQNKRNINLLPKEDFDKTTLGRILKWSLTTFRFIVIMVEFVVIAGFLSRFWLDVKIGDLDSEIQDKSSVIAAQYPFEQNYRKLQAKLAAVAKITSDKNSILPLVDTIAQNIPVDIQLSNLTKTDTTVDIQGSSISESAISQFMSDLEGTPKFSAVTLRRMEYQNEIGDIQFELKATIAEGR